MEFSEREIADLATFFAKRFPSYEQRAALSEAAGLAGEAQLTGDARTAWADVVRVALQKGRLNDLVERAQQQRPDDDNLREMAIVVRAGRRWRGSRLGLLAGLVLVSLGVVLVWSPWSSKSGEAEPPLPGSSADVGEHDDLNVAARLGGEIVAEPGGELAAEPVAAVLDEPEVEPVAAPAPEPSSPAVAEAPLPPPTEPVAEPVAAPRPRPAAAPLRCEGPDGEVIGYWYAGEEAPPKGSSYTVDGGLNVRVDYPDVHNDFDARSALVCTLGHGWQLRIGHEPLAVPGGAYWVPLAADDIIAR